MSSTFAENPRLVAVGEETQGTVATLDDSAHGQCVNGTAAVLLTMELPGIGDRVHVRQRPALYDDDTTPCVMVCPFLTRETREGTNSEQDVHYLVLIAVHRAAGRDAINGMGADLYCQETIRKRFAKKPARSIGFLVEANGSCVKQSDIDSAEAINQQAWEAGLAVHYIIVDYLVRLGYSN